MTIVNNPNAPIQVPATPNTFLSTAVEQVSAFVQDHFIEGGKLGVTMATFLSRLPQGFARESTMALQERLPDMQRRIADLPTALRAVAVSGGDPDTRDHLRIQLTELSQDASLTARTGALWGVAGLAIAAIPFTLTTGYALGAALGQARTNRLISQAMDTDGAMEASFIQVQPGE